MLTVEQFYNRVSREINQGTVYDEILKDYVGDAFLWIERTHTFKHMERFVCATIDLNRAEPRSISTPPGYKSMKIMRLIVSESDIRRLALVDPDDIIKRETKKYPTGYWQDGVDFFWFDNVPAQNTTVELSYVGYTIVPTDTDVVLPIITNMRDVVLATTMTLMAGILKMDTKLKATYKSQRDEGMDSAVLADKEQRDGGRDDSMTYSGERRN